MTSAARLDLGPLTKHKNPDRSKVAAHLEEYMPHGLSENHACYLLGDERIEVVLRHDFFMCDTPAILELAPDAEAEPDLDKRKDFAQAAAARRRNRMEVDQPIPSLSSLSISRTPPPAPRSLPAQRSSPVVRGPLCRHCKTGLAISRYSGCSCFFLCVDCRRTIAEDDLPCDEHPPQ